jgi:hypothetical protein
MTNAVPLALARSAPVDPLILVVIEALARRQARLDYEASQSSGSPSMPSLSGRD